MLWVGLTAAAELLSPIVVYPRQMALYVHGDVEDAGDGERVFIGYKMHDKMCERTRRM